MKIAWGITGAGDLLQETIDAMDTFQRDTGVRIDVFVSKAGRQVLHWYRLWNRLNLAFERVKVEVDANVPFIAGPLQIGTYGALVIAPLTANSAAKIAHGIEDTLLTNAVGQTLKGNTPVFLLPVDHTFGEIETMAPDGTRFIIKTRKVDIDNVERLRIMDGITVVTSVPSLIVQLNSLL